MELNFCQCICSLKVGLAEKTAVLFTKDGEQHNNLHDMQCMWLVIFNFFCDGLDVFLVIFLIIMIFKSGKV